MDSIAAFALGTLFGMFALLLVGMVANAATRRAEAWREQERERLKATTTESLDRNALEVDRLAMERRKTRTMWGE